MRKLIAAAALLVVLQAHAATSFSTDVTDLWWNPDESGWGVNVIQQRNIVFATFFIYDGDGRAHWYVASNMTAGAPVGSSMTFQGDLFETKGPYFGVPFNAAAVTRERVGVATLEFQLPDTGVLTYSIRGAIASKRVRRQTWSTSDASGSYEGARVVVPGAASSCPAGASSFSNIQIVQSATAFNMIGDLAALGASCHFSGNYSQQGHLGSSTGTYTCGGLEGAYSLTEIETTLYGFSAHYNAVERNCVADGRIGGVRRTIIRQAAQ